MRKGFIIFFIILAVLCLIAGIVSGYSGYYIMAPLLAFASWLIKDSRH